MTTNAILIPDELPLSDRVAARELHMSEDDARLILDAPRHLGGWWAEYIDPSRASSATDDPDQLADEAWDSFEDEWLDQVDNPDMGIDEIDIRAALRIAAQAYVDMLQDEQDYSPGRGYRNQQE